MQTGNAALKFAGYSTVLLIGDYLVPGLFLSVWTALFTALVLTITGVFGDALILPRLGNGKSLSIGVFGMVAIIYLVPRLWPASEITLTRAVVLALFLLPLEYVLHSWILHTLFSRSE